MSDEIKEKKMNDADGGAGGRPLEVCLLGASLTTGNMGCRALTMSLLGLIASVWPKARLTLLYGNKEPFKREVRISENRTVRVELVNYRLSPKARLREHMYWIFFLALIHRFVPLAFLRRKIHDSNAYLNRLWCADFVGDIRGGDSFSDIYGLRRSLSGSLPLLTAILMGKHFVLLPQTFGPFEKRFPRAIARFIMRRADRIYSRDEQSLELVRELLGDRDGRVPVGLSPDVAFSLELLEPKRLAIEPPLDAEGCKTLVALNVSGLLFGGGYSGDNMFGLKCDYPKMVRALLSRLLQIEGVHILLVPHTFGSAPLQDQGVCRQLWQESPQEVKDRTHLVAEEYDQNEIKAVIGRCDFLIGSRMHATIAGLSLGIPSVGLAYSRKFPGRFRFRGCGGFGSGRSKPLG